MKKHEKKTVNVNPLSNQELIDSYDYLATAASSHDCTGLRLLILRNWIRTRNFIHFFLRSHAQMMLRSRLRLPVRIHLILRVNVHLKILCKIPVFP